MEKWHTAEPDKLVVMTECCSCPTMRGVDADMPAEDDQGMSDENSHCLQEQVTVSDALPYVGGTFVWTLHD